MDDTIKGHFPPIITPHIVYDDGSILVVAKPSGMHCAPASDPDTLCSWVFSRYPAIGGVKGRCKGEGGLLHRLDAATSGLVAFAADEQGFECMMSAAEAGSFVKTYMALGLPTACGLMGSKPETMSPHGAIEAVWIRMLRDGDSEGLARMLSGTYLESGYRSYGPGGSRVACCLTEYLNSPLASKGKSWAKDTYRSDFIVARAETECVLTEITLTRGFRHQVRAHMAWLGLPLKGDAVYGDGDIDEQGLCLRATGLSFPAINGGSTIHIELD